MHSLQGLYENLLHLSVEPEELPTGRYSWGSAGVLVFPWIKETPCCISTPNRNSLNLTLSAYEWHDALTNQITEIVNKNLSTESIYFLSSRWVIIFTTPCYCLISMEVYRLDWLLKPHLARLVFESSLASSVVYSR